MCVRMAGRMCWLTFATILWVAAAASVQVFKMQFVVVVAGFLVFLLLR